MTERRKFIRWKTEEKMLLGAEGEKKESILDISPGGMRIVLDVQLKEGSALTGQFKIAPGQKPFYVRGEVVWVRQAADQNNKTCYEAGVKFNKISTIPI